LKTLEKIKRKTIRNSEKKGKPFQPKPAQSSPAGPRARTPVPPDRWTPPVSGGLFPTHSLSHSLCPVGPVCRRQSPSPTRPLSVSALRARLVSAMSNFPRALASSLYTLGPLCQLHLPRKPPWTSAHVHREPWPRRLPTQPRSLLSIAHTRSLSLASFRASSPSLTLCSRRSPSLEFLARRAGHPARRKPC
jgi:hypothetical protein